MLSKEMDGWLETLVKNGVFEDKDFALQCFTYCVARIWKLANLTYDMVKSTENSQVGFPITDLYGIEHLHYYARFGTMIEKGLNSDKYKAPITKETVPSVGPTPADPMDLEKWKQDMVDNGIVKDIDLIDEMVVRLAFDFCKDGGILTMQFLKSKFGNIFPIKSLDSVENYIQKFIRGTVFEVEFDKNNIKNGFPTKYKKAITEIPIEE